MANLMLGFPNRIDAATLSGGSWSSAFPITELQNRQLGEPARTTNDANASTIINIDQGAETTTRVLGLCRTNLSQDAQWRIRGDPTDIATADYDSGWIDVWPVTYSADQLALYPWDRFHILPAAMTHRLWRIEIDDDANPYGYVQLARPFIGPAIQPNMNTLTGGTSLGFASRSLVNQAQLGAKYTHRRAAPRIHRILLDAMLQPEAMTFLDMLGQADVTEEVLFIQDPSVDTYALQNRFLASFRQLSSIEYPRYVDHQLAGEVEELLPEQFEVYR